MRIWHLWFRIVLALVLGIGILVICSLAAHGQDLVDGPKPQRPMWDFYSAWGAWGGLMVADGALSAHWAGRGPSPCAWEGNQSFARPDGTFRSGKYYLENGLIGGGLFAINFVIRKKAPPNIANHWAVRALGVFFPVYRGQQHARNVVSWVHLCG